MPSASAQQALIESTYAKAGLNLASAEDRPQFFEAVSCFLPKHAEHSS